MEWQAKDSANDLPCYFIPHPQNCHFFGRDAELDGLHTALVNQAQLPDKPKFFKCRPKLIGISGLGGVGKTELALQCVYVHKAEFDVVLWMQCGSIKSAKDDFSRAAGALGLVPGQRVLDWLSKTSMIQYIQM